MATYKLTRNTAIETALASYLDAVQTRENYSPAETRAVLWGFSPVKAEFEKEWDSLTFKAKKAIREEAMALMKELRPKYSESTHKRGVEDLGFRLRAERSDKGKGKKTLEGILVGLIRTALAYAAKHGLEFDAALEAARDGAESEE